MAAAAGGIEAFRARRTAVTKFLRVKRRLGFRGLLAVLAALAPALAFAAVPGAASEPERVVVRSGTLLLQALLWRPEGRGPFPAVLFHHGSYGRSDRLGMDQAAALGKVFARHGYVFLFLFRRGIGLSEGQGVADGVLMDRAFRAHGLAGRNRVQLRLMENDEMGDATAALAFLRGLPEVDPRRVALAGHSFGGSLAVLQAAREPGVSAAVIFSGSAYSWPLSSKLRTRLLAAVGRTRAAIFFIHAANDYSTVPGEALSAEMARLGKPHRLKIYPAVGRTTREGHNFVYSDVAAWEPDVFSFLDEMGAPEAER